MNTEDEMGKGSYFGIEVEALITPGPLLSGSLSRERIHRGHGRPDFEADPRTGSLTRTKFAAPGNGILLLNGNS
jgi:hypothetical protein